MQLTLVPKIKNITSRFRDVALNEILMKDQLVSVKILLKWLKISRKSEFRTDISKKTN